MALTENSVAVSLNKLLVATDFLPMSNKAAAYAKGLAQHFGSSIEVAHIFDPSVVSFSEKTVGLPIYSRRDTINHALALVKKDFEAAGIRSEATVGQGHRPFVLLLQIARDKKVDLIVVGTESKSGEARLVFGSTAEELIRNAKTPVLTIGPNVPMPEAGPLIFKKIICAIDMSKDSADVVECALSVAKQSGARLYCCYILCPEVENSSKKEALDRAFRSALSQTISQHPHDECHVEYIVEPGNDVEAILNIATRVNADLIVLSARQASFSLTYRA